MALIKAISFFYFGMKGKPRSQRKCGGIQMKGCHLKKQHFSSFKSSYSVEHRLTNHTGLLVIGKIEYLVVYSQIYN